MTNLFYWSHKSFIFLSAIFLQPGNFPFFNPSAAKFYLPAQFPIYGNAKIQHPCCLSKLKTLACPSGKPKQSKHFLHI
jgi:hypothetical protein